MIRGERPAEAPVRQVIDFLTTPSTFLLTLCCLGLLLLLLHRHRAAAVSLAAGLGGFLVFGFTSASELAIAPLTQRFPPLDLERAEPPFGIVVLGAGLNEVHAAHAGTLMELEEGGEAVPTAALLARRYPEARIVLSGGNGTGFPPPPLRGADGMRRLLLEFGVAPERIAIDPASATTFERARNTLALIGEDRDEVWWAITPAHRMPRLIGTYRRQGFEPVPVPVDYRWIPPFVPTYLYAFTDGLRLTDEGIHEWRGLLLYRAEGKIDDVFPGPRR
jgi:uncharacterized SAM-binding protein YcdF (DUF218 family)